MLTVLRSRRGITTCTLLAALTAAACGGPSPSARHAPSAAEAPKSAAATATAPTTHAATPGARAVARRWMQRFCADPAEHAAIYIVEYKDAVQATASHLTVDDLESTKQVLSSTVSSLDAATVDSADRLAAATPPKAVDAARARTHLLGVYQQLHQALTSARARLSTVPTTDARRFMAAFRPVAADLVAAIRRSQDAVRSYAILGPAFNANPKCVAGVVAYLPSS